LGKKKKKVVVQEEKNEQGVFEFFGYKENEERVHEIEEQPSFRRIHSSNLTLQKLETAIFGIEDVKETSLSEKDACKKFNLPKRLRYFLEVQSHAQLFYENPNLSEQSVKFAEYGGKLILCPYDPNEIERDNFKIGILPSDLLYPICSDGLIRSQILYLVLLGIKRMIGTESGVNKPHGANFGFDPFILEDSQQYDFLSVEDFNTRLKSLFESVFGQSLEPRFGEDRYGTNPKLNFNESRSTQLETKRIRETMKDIFTLKYFALPNNPEGRIIFFVFGAALPIVLDRLMESNTSQVLKGSNLLVYAFPFDSHKKIANARDLENIYSFYASLFQPIKQM